MFPSLKIPKQLKMFLQNSSICISSRTIPTSSCVFSWCLSLAYPHQAKENLALGAGSWHSDLVLSITFFVSSSRSWSSSAGSRHLEQFDIFCLAWFQGSLCSPNGEWDDEKWACKNLSTAANFLINSVQQHNFDPAYRRAVCYVQVCSILQDWQRRVNLSF